MSLRSRIWKSAFILGIGLAVTPGYSAEPQDEAKALMLKACDSYANVQSGKLRALVSVDTFAAGDHKIQKNTVVEIMAKRPNKFKAVAQGDEMGSVTFNGKQITAIDSKTGFYAQSDFEGDLKGFLDQTEKLNLPTDGLEFISAEFCKNAVAKVSSAEKLSALVLDGEQVEHLAFINKKEGIHWEAWIKQVGERYVVKKVVITSAHIKQQPQYEYLLISEELDANIDDTEFEAVVSRDQKKIGFLSDLGSAKEIVPAYRYGTARRVARRTSRRVAYRHSSYYYYNSLPYYYYSYPASTSPRCEFTGTLYNCAGVFYRPAIEGGTTVYVKETK